MLRVVTHVLRYAKAVRSSAKRQAPRMVPRLDARFPALAGNGGPSFFALWFEAVVVDLDVKMEIVESGENVYLGSLRTLGQLRERRDGQVKPVYRSLLVVRSSVEVGFGPGKGEQFVGLDAGLSGVDPEVLRRYSRMSIGVLEDPEFSPDIDGTGKSWIEWQEAAKDLRPATDALSGTLETIRDQKRDVEEAQRLRDDSVEDLHVTSLAVAENLSSFFRYAGVKFHADRVRLGTRLPVRSPNARDETEPGSAEPESDLVVPEVVSEEPADASFPDHPVPDAEAPEAVPEEPQPDVESHS